MKLYSFKVNTPQLDLKNVLKNHITVSLNALRESQAHLYLTVDIAACDFHVTRIHGFNIQIGQTLNGPDQFRRISSVHVRPADISVREDRVA